jgi:AbrB family looped-hinge helix DNA binding protein
MSTAAVKITSKGQVTIPKEIRDILKTDIVYFDIMDDAVIVKPVKDVAGSLHKYAKKIGMPFEKAKKKAWEEAAREKFANKSS